MHTSSERHIVRDRAVRARSIVCFHVTSTFTTFKENGYKNINFLAIQVIITGLDCVKLNASSLRAIKSW